MLQILNVKIMTACTLVNGYTKIKVWMECNQVIEIIITVAYTEIIMDAQMNQKCEQKKYNSGTIVPPPKIKGKYFD